MVCIRMGGTPTLQVELVILVFGNLSLRTYLLIILSYPYIWVMVLALNLGKIFGSEQLFQRFFLGLHPSSLHNTSICQFFSWMTSLGTLIFKEISLITALGSFLRLHSSFWYPRLNHELGLLIPWEFSLVNLIFTS